MTYRSQRKTPKSLPVYDQRVQHITLQSTALGLPKSFYVYAPPGLAPGQRVPSLYLLRGHEREWVNPFEDDSRGGTNVIDIYEQLRTAGEIGPMLLVFPGLSSNDNAIPSALMNMRAPEHAAKVAGIGKGQFADYFYDELIPFVDANFPTHREARRRGLLGFSLGGAMAVKAAAERPGLFATAAAYDGTFLYAHDNGRTVKPDDGVIHNQMFDAAFGVPRDLAHIAANNPANLILRGNREQLASITWMISFGPRSGEPWHANYYRGVHLLRCLSAQGITNSIKPADLLNRAHTWRIADAFAALTLPIHYRVLSAE